MDRERAASIVGHLLDAASAMESADRAIASLGKEERLKFHSLLDSVLEDLHCEVLAPIFDQFPELEPEWEGGEIPAINSELGWDQVRLLPSLSEKDLDDILLSEIKSTWRKVALVVGNATVRCEALGWPVSSEMLAARLQVLAETGLIEDVGDLRIRRFSEVRLKD